MNPVWSPDAWQSKLARQQPVYADVARLNSVLAELSQLPPLVTWWEVENLKAQIADAGVGRRFLLQGGDCAERYDDCGSDQITSKLKILLQMSLVLTQGSKRPVVRMGRLAGQYAKPRSEDFETRDGVRLPSYRGDLINRPAFTPESREPDPGLLMEGYYRAALTLNHVRALVRNGFADLHHPEYWDLSFTRRGPMAEEYRRMAESVGESLRFMENVLGVRAGELNWVECFTCHEALILAYEQAQTHRVPECDGWYNLSTHFPWIGLRTADPDEAHVEYFRGIRNPIGVKVGANWSPDALARLLDTLHPDNEPGRLTIIHRFGHQKIADRLAPLVETVRRSGKTVVWVCDPMHGNTRSTASGIKTRRFDDILAELEQAFAIHAAEGSVLGGVHFEMTGEDVTECLGGTTGLTESDLPRAYRSEVDPRLNYEQALEMAMLIARKMMAGAAALPGLARTK